MTALPSTNDMTPSLPGIIGSGPAMQEVYRVTRQVAGSNASVLLLGETGTGKELIAHAIHDLSQRTARPFVQLIASFHQRYPAVVVHLELTARNVDLVQEGYDIAFRPHSRAVTAGAMVCAHWFHWSLSRQERHSGERRSASVPNCSASSSALRPLHAIVMHFSTSGRTSLAL